MGEMNLKGQYEACEIAQRYYNHPCLNLVCGYNKYSGICNHRFLFETREVIETSNPDVIAQLIQKDVDTGLVLRLR